MPDCRGLISYRSKAFPSVIQCLQFNAQLGSETLRAPVTVKYLRQLYSQWERLTHLPTIVLVPLAIAATSTVVTGLLLGVRQLGGLQPLELASYDQMVRLLSDQATDPRLLIVAITEADIKAQKRWPLSDLTIATVLQKLQQLNAQ